MSVLDRKLKTSNENLSTQFVEKLYFASYRFFLNFLGIQTPYHIVTTFLPCLGANPKINGRKQHQKNLKNSTNINSVIRPSVYRKGKFSVAQKNFIEKTFFRIKKLNFNQKLIYSKKHAKFTWTAVL